MQSVNLFRSLPCKYPWEIPESIFCSNCYGLNSQVYQVEATLGGFKTVEKATGKRFYLSQEVKVMYIQQKFLSCGEPCSPISSKNMTLTKRLATTQD